MKKFLALLLAVAMLLTLAACGPKADNKDQNNDANGDDIQTEGWVPTEPINVIVAYKAGSGSLRFGFHTGDLGAGVCGTGEEPPLGDSSPFLRLVVVGWLVIYLVGCQSYSCHPPERVIVSISNCVSLTEIYQSRLTSLLTIRQERILISAATKVSSSPGFSGSITSSGSYTGVPRPVRDLMFAL